MVKRGGDRGSQVPVAAAGQGSGNTAAVAGVHWGWAAQAVCIAAARPAWPVNNPAAAAAAAAVAAAAAGDVRRVGGSGGTGPETWRPLQQKSIHCETFFICETYVSRATQMKQRFGNCHGQTCIVLVACESCLGGAAGKLTAVVPEQL
jgi:hypothetical protein